MNGEYEGFILSGTYVKFLLTFTLFDIIGYLISVLNIFCVVAVQLSCLNGLDSLKSNQTNILRQYYMSVTIHLLQMIMSIPTGKEWFLG